MTKRLTAASPRLTALLLLVTACAGTDEAGPDNALVLAYDLPEGAQGWTGDFTDLPVDYEEDLYQLTFENAKRPDEAGEGGALMLSGQNASDDVGNLWIFVGTDSGFEGRTTRYYTSINVELVPVD